MTDFVVDASVACSWVLPDEASTIGDTAYARLQTNRALVPDLFWHEARNVLMMTYRPKRIDFAMVATAMAMLRMLPIRTLGQPHDQPIFTLAERHNLTAYDAAYLALALETKLPLATLDKQLITAATQGNVLLLA
ncbi:MULTISPECIES: type II toxin-antitoxin system VapC family toxin [Rhizobiaceae]|jgi:predicted nucleic acid-binding protein|uniref:Putative nucleic acid-binding protein n=1 Tax=Aliirhizobium cellulosilyticum TaxID=393664 RepID=A0A7W6XC87_9HYPH|nr:type II toxin-antitoxin system VapC family toxin [Rhizobium cellulosilyticum]MBB4350438.1 putative nucleic acid-binding protein [Rhizobium cellulosilyticum]MBB4413530.1 putative nucleic acid-binding protein [Rhizobium cellulosilyticum]MBB4448163.1 putative nucleic acid-binding protein [Rhizobium cellulosilyticum]